MNPCTSWRAVLPVALAAAAVLVPTTTADAACSPTLSPSSVVAGKNTVSVTFKVTGCSIVSWTVSPTDAGPLAYAESGDPTLTFPVGDLNGLVNSYAGAHPLRLRAWNTSGKLVTDSNRTVSWLRRTDFPTFNASPEPVKKGAAMNITGSIRRVNWDTNAYGGYAGHKVVIQRRLPGGSFTDVTTVTTDSAGTFNATVTASKTATWRARSGATTLSAASTSPGDAVTVD